MPEPSLSRRTALGGAGAGTVALALSGCSIDLSALGGKDDRTPVQKAAALDPDARLVAELVATVGTTSDLLERTRTTYPALRPQLAPLTRATTAHLAVLRKAVSAGDLPTIPPTTPTVPATRPQALSAVQANVAELRKAYFTGAAKADSGGFAQLLAGMGAALSQRLGAPA